VAPVATVGLVFTLVQGRSELLRFARKSAASAADAEDALQELCIKVLSQRHTLRDPAKGLPWLKVTLRNIVIDGHRRRQVLEGAEAVFSESVTASASPDAQDRFVACNCLEAALEAPRDDLVARIDLAGEAHHKVATELGITEGNLRVRLLRARRALCREIEHRCADCPAYDGSLCVCHDRGADDGNDRGGLPSINWE
jgi:RNA polymerase sigma-70 factor (ECF subfamily)